MGGTSTTTEDDLVIGHPGGKLKPYVFRLPRLRRRAGDGIMSLPGALADDFDPIVWLLRKFRGEKKTSA